MHPFLPRPVTTLDTFLTSTVTLVLLLLLLTVPIEVFAALAPLPAIVVTFLALTLMLVLPLMTPPGDAAHPGIATAKPTAQINTYLVNIGFINSDLIIKLWTC